MKNEVYDALSKTYPGLAFKQHEAVNKYLSETVVQGRVPDGFVFGNEAVDSLVNPGKKRYLIGQKSWFRVSKVIRPI